MKNPDREVWGFPKKTPFSEVSVRRFKGVSYALNPLSNERYNL